MIVHGGDVWQVAEELGIAATDILDFSANINPRGLPSGARERLLRDASDALLLKFYPDPSARHLRKALSEQLGVDADSIVVGPGAEALLAPILRSVLPQRALVPIPAFSEYRRVCEQQEVAFMPFSLHRDEMFRTSVDRFMKDIEFESPDVVMLNNPHNPTGGMLGAEDLRRVVEAAHTVGATLVLDEAFIDYVPHGSMASEAAYRPGLIVLRSLTKFYGCPALRVGYAVAQPDTVRRIQASLPTWPMTQLALDALAEAVLNVRYAEESLRENAVERERLGESLSGLGLFVFPSVANYLFLELSSDMPTAAALRIRLIESHHILIRNCDSYEGLLKGRYIRVAVRSREENSRLIKALHKELS